MDSRHNPETAHIPIDKPAVAEGVILTANTFEAKILPLNSEEVAIQPSPEDSAKIEGNDKIGIDVEPEPKLGDDIVVVVPPEKPKVDFKPLVYHDIHFDSAKWIIKPVPNPRIAHIADNLHNFPDIHIIIKGHTDAGGSLEANKLLSERRAKTVKTALVA